MSRCLLACLLLWWSACEAHALSVRECIGAHGERVFSDRGDCTEVRRWQLAEPPPFLAPAAAVEPPWRPARARGGHSQAARDHRESFLCSTPSRNWYQHTPCRIDSTGARGKRESVRQRRISRVQACREIERPAAALRRGSERDQRAGPYDKAMGRDPCR